MKIFYFNRLIKILVLVFLIYSCNNTSYEIKKNIYLEFPFLKVTVFVRNGERVQDFLARLEEQGLTEKTAFLEIAQNTLFSEFSFVPVPIANINRFEGLFYPGEYSFSLKQLQPLDCVSDNKLQAFYNAQFIINELLKQSAIHFKQLSKVNELSQYEYIILASIVEKEAAANKGYDKIASVFFNRLRKKMNLSSCPAVEYALGYHRPFLFEHDISINSPYNLYLKNGLPPTPICFFSEQALKAVINPPDTDLYFFVFDWTTNELLFASDYKEHIINSDNSKANYIKKNGKDALFKIYYNKYYEE